MKGVKVAQRLFRKTLNRETQRVLDEYASRAHRHRLEFGEELAKLSAGGAQTILLGTTRWGQKIELPLEKL